MKILLRRFRYVPALACALAVPASLAAEPVESTEPTVEEPSVSTPAEEGVPTLQMTADFAFPGLELGTYRPMGQVEARAIRVAPFNIRAAIQSGFGYDDNVALSDANKVGSFFASVAPSIAVGLEGALQRYYLVYRGNYGTYASTAQNDYADHNVSLSAFNSWTTRLRSTLSYDYVNAHTPRGSTITAGATAERWSTQAFRAGVSYGAEGAQGRVEGSVGHRSRRYTAGATAAISEYDSVDAGGSFHYRLAPKTQAIFQVGWSDIEHPGDPSLDNIENRYAIGVTWEALAKTTARAAVGIMTKDFSSPIRSDFSGPSFEAAVNWRPQGYSSVNFSARRFLNESYELGSDFVVNTVAGVTWNHAWPRQVRSTFIYTYGRLTQEGLSRTDTYHNLGGRVSYPLRRSLRVGAEFRRDSRDSNSDTSTVDYTRNIILLTVETAL